MKILHFSDTHLGYQDLDKLVDGDHGNGVNLREQDLYKAFEHVIDQALELKPDLIIHSGDFFHRPSPANRPMIFAIEQLNRLSKAGIPIVILAGNHETPKTIYTSPILKAFRTVDNVYPIFSQKYEKFSFGDVVIHGVPHINDPALELEEMKKVLPEQNKRNILMLHTSVGKRYLMEEFGERIYPMEWMELLDEFDYVALGHWHNFQKVESLSSAWYSGSIERLSDSETNHAKGFCMLTLTGDEKVVPKFFEVPARPWHKFVLKDCQSQSVPELEKKIQEEAEKLDLKRSLVSIYFQDIRSLQAVELPNRRVTELLSDAVHVTIKRKFVMDEEDGFDHSHPSESLEQLMDDYIEENVADNEKQEALKKQARYYFGLFESGEVN